MNWEQVQGQWHQLAGTVKTKWGKLTDDDIKVVAGHREQLVGKLQERYGIAKEDAEKQIESWYTKLDSPAIKPPPRGKA